MTGRSSESVEHGAEGTPDVFGRCAACARLTPHSALGGGAAGDPNLICLDDEVCEAFDRWVS